MLDSCHRAPGSISDVLHGICDEHSGTGTGLITRTLASRVNFQYTNAPHPLIYNPVNAQRAHYTPHACRHGLNSEEHTNITKKAKAALYMTNEHRVEPG